MIDAYARRILGWSVAALMTTQLVLDAIEQAIWTRHRDGRELVGLVVHHDHGSQNLSPAYTDDSTLLASSRRSVRSDHPSTTRWPRRSPACTRLS